VGTPPKAVFLSYASQDAEVARRICDALRAGGLEVWLDQSELRGGDAWDASIRRKIKECALFVPLISANTQARAEGYFRREWNLAVSRTLDMADDQAFLLPVVIDATVDLNARVPEKFREVQWMRLPAGEASADFSERVHRLLSGGAAPLLLVPASRVVSAAAPAIAIPSREPPSIAVLPFVNMSRDEENEYFADGLSEELLNVLAKIKGLRVASRTSAWSFKGTRTDIPTIAQKLGVAHLLEGSVRKAGNRVRITAQLIEVATDSHLWSETYDRELTDIFAVQDDIAQSVVVELRRALLDGKVSDMRKDAVATEVAHAAQGRGEDAVAYQLFLEACSRANRVTKDDNARAIELLRQAVALQPDFALAWAGLSRAHNQSVAAGFAMPAEGYAQARAAAQRALALAPDLVEGLVALGQVLASDDLDWKGADATFRKAIEVAPGNAIGLHSASWLAAVYGRIDEALALARRIVALDPLAVNGHVRLARLLADSGAYGEAEAELATARLLKLAGPRHHGTLGRIRLYQGRYAEALAEFEQETVEWERKSGIALARFRLGPPEAADAALQDIITHDADTAAIQIAEVYAYRDEKDAAFAWLERAYVQKDHGVSMLRSQPTFRGLHDDPRWRGYLAKIGLAD